MSESTAAGSPAARAPFITRVGVENYRSIGSCDLSLGPLTILVGQNGAGKTSILDALDFLCRAVSTSPAQALDERGGLDAVLCQVPASAASFTIAVEAATGWRPGQPAGRARYEIVIGRGPDGGMAVLREDCTAAGQGGVATLRAGLGHAVVTTAGEDPVEADAYEPGRLFLPVAGTLAAAFAPLRAGLTLARFYDLVTDTLRMPRRPVQPPVLRRGGEGIADVLAGDGAGGRIDAYLSAIVPGATGVRAREAGGYRTIVLEQEAGGVTREFTAEAMSEGTVRAAGVLAALFQPDSLAGRLPLIGIEEPERSLHPTAAGVLFDALTEASEFVQVIATSQSPDLLDREDADPALVRPVVLRDGLTVAGEVDDASREILRQKLCTLGDLMRGNQLSPQGARDADPGT